MPLRDKICNLQNVVSENNRLQSIVCGLETNLTEKDAIVWDLETKPAKKDALLQDKDDEITRLRTKVAH